MIISRLHPLDGGVHREEPTFYQCVPTGNTSESPMPCPCPYLHGQADIPDFSFGNSVPDFGYAVMVQCFRFGL
jgi:hypothetical protein